MTERRDRVMGPADAPAVGRFTPGGPVGYRALSDPTRRLWPTRADALAEERRIRDAR